MLEKYLDKNNLLIVPKSLKKKVVKVINNYNRLISYKIMDLEEFLGNYFFSYDKKTIYYTMNKLNKNYEITLEYLDSLYYIEDKNYSYKKLNDIKDLKQDLIDHNLLIYNPNFKYYLNNTKIIVYGYILDPFYINILNNYNYEIVSLEYDKKKLNILEFNYIDEEIGYIAFDIKQKLDSGVDINDIKLINPASEYNNVLKRIFSLSNIPLDINNKISLYDIPIGKKIISLIKDNMDFTSILDTLNNIDDDILNEIINIFNNYVDFDLDTINLLDLVIYDLKNTYLKNNRLKNSVTIASIDEVNNNDYIYLVGFNKENYPKIYKDQDFLSDKMKEELSLFTSNDKNQLENAHLRNNLYRLDNCLITYKLNDAFTNFNPSLITLDDDINIIKNNTNSYNFSNNYNLYSLAVEKDNFYKYGIISNDLKKLNSSYDQDFYRTYDNKFTGINIDSYLNNIKSLSLSYSVLDNYFKCGFKYYLKNVLNIKEINTDTFFSDIGDIFHYILSKYRQPNFDLDKLWNEEIKKYNFTLDKLVLLNKLKEELIYSLSIIKKQELLTNFDDYLFEHPFRIPINNSKDKNVSFIGIADKLLYMKKNNNTLVSIIDYKTGTLHTDMDNIIYGINMQLPIYLYLVKRSNLFPNSIIAGFYLQKIINKDEKILDEEKKNEKKESYLKLVGYSNSDIEILKEFDNSYANSNLIRSLKIIKSGDFAKNSKVLSNLEIDKIDEIVENNINNGVEDILNAKFDINPKKINDDEIGCEYCKFYDICYKKEKDYKNLDLIKLIDALGGDDDA